MKKILILVALATALFASCSSDNPMADHPDNNSGSNELISPNVQATVNSTDNTQSPMSGILEIYPCQPGTSIYYDNYINDVLSPFPGYYNLQNGDIFGTNNRPISLPVSTYNIFGNPQI